MDKQKTIRVGDKMKGPEPIIVEYDVKDWKNPNYNGADVNKAAMPKLGLYYRGLLRYNTSDDTDIAGGNADENIN